MRQHLKRLALLPFMLCAACAYTVQSPNVRCSELVPAGWETGVDGAGIPATVAHADGHEDARPWQVGFVAQSGQLEKANGRGADALHIIRRCEAMVATVDAPRRWWQVWK